MEIVPERAINQFVLTQDTNLYFPSWAKRELSGYYLHTHPYMPVSEIRNTYRTCIGWLVGYCFCDGGILSNESTFESKIEQGLLPTEVLKKFSGRYIFIYITDSVQRFYLDPGGSLGAVYSDRANIIASTTGLINFTEQLHKPDDLIRSQFPGNFVPFGLTPFQGIRKLLPNHYLDLNKWNAVRHSPKENAPFQEIDLDTAVQRISKIMVSQTNALVKEGVNMTLTAGFDNRMMLATAKNVHEKITFFTNRKSNKVDISISNKLSRYFHLKHYFIPSHIPAEQELKELNQITGDLVENSSLANIPDHNFFLNCENFQLTGAGGETARCFYWRKHDTERKRLDAKELLQRLRVSIDNKLVNQEVNKWFEQLSYLNTFQILDLLYLEQDFGVRASNNMYLYDYLSMTPIHAFNHKTIYDCMIGLSPEHKLNSELPKKLIEYNWPELLKYPINEFVGIRNIPFKLMRLIYRTLKN